MSVSKLNENEKIFILPKCTASGLWFMHISLVDINKHMFQAHPVAAISQTPPGGISHFFPCLAPDPLLESLGIYFLPHH